jgi:hypothetical protein
MSPLKMGTFEKMFEGAAVCRSRGLDIPMLVLIYSALDTLAWVVYGHEIVEVKRRFVAVCEKYVLSSSSFECTALELYAARCSILHSLGWESELSKAGKARAVFYSFGSDNPEIAQEAFDHAHPGRFIAVRADELLKAVMTAVACVTEQANHDSALASRMEVADGKQYMALESDASNLLYGGYLKAVGERNGT